MFRYYKRQSLSTISIPVNNSEDLVIQSQSVMDRKTDRVTDTVRQTPRRQLRCVKHYILSCVKNRVPF